MSRFERESRQFERLLRELGDYELARRIDKLPSYRRYKKKYPFDGEGQILSLEMFADQNFHFADPSPGPDELYAAKEELENFQAGLTARQRRIADRLGDGYYPKEFYEEEGYRNTGGIRYHRFIMRRRHKQKKDVDNLS